ncbi:DUF5960 family protein [Enterococcus viikkiensis]|uniref:DUF5960 family protein n=1 Tax=Enterococcus viikkiensis TaxID=930854 RepID=UPI0035E19963
MINKNEIAFYYDQQMLKRLAADFMRVADTDVPFSLLEDELLFLMDIRGVSNFRIPARKTRYGLDHIFYFEIFENEDYPKPKLYKYKYQRIERRNE